MIGFRPDHVGITESEKLSSLYPDWLRIVVVPGKLLESAFCAQGYWSKVEDTVGLFDAANDEYVETTATRADEITVSALFISGYQVDGLLVRQVEIEAILTPEVASVGLFGRAIVARGILEACD